MSSLDTELPGDPGSVTALGAWLSDTLAPEVDSAGTTLTQARTTAIGDWTGTAGQEFAATMRAATTRTDELQSHVRGAGAAVTVFGEELRALQQEMAGIRSDAAAAGLTVRGFRIQSPGTGPALPGPMPEDALGTPLEGRHAAAVAAYEEHQRLIRAWNTAVEQVEDVWRRYVAAGEPLQDRYRGLSGAQWTLTAADIAGGMAGGVMAYQATALRGSGQYYRGLAARHLEWARNADPAVSGRARWYADYDEALRKGQYADDLLRNADDLDGASRGIPLKLGGALAIAGIGYEIYNGKDPVQATVSGGLGFGASVAAGAAIGTMIPVPVVGTAVGALVGAGVGIFTSGMVDNLFEGGSVGDALGAGWDAVEDTGAAIGDGLEAAGDAIGDGIESVGDAIGGLFG